MQAAGGAVGPFVQRVLARIVPLTSTILPSSIVSAPARSFNFVYSTDKPRTDDTHKKFLGLSQSDLTKRCSHVLDERRTAFESSERSNR